MQQNRRCLPGSQYVLLSDEIGKWGGDISKATLPDTSLVDYIRVYDLADGSAPASKKSS